MRHAEGDVEEIVTGVFDYDKREPVNYVNPWDQRVAAENPEDKRMWGHYYHPYEGPVYKKVPVIEGIKFPLDPDLYYPPLEPPKPGAKWGDGRAPDGNWYMNVDGEQVQYYQGVGSRLSAYAIVRLVKGNGQLIINGLDGLDYLNYNPFHWFMAVEPLAALAKKNQYDVIAKCFGGGKKGQAGAIRMGLGRSLQEMDFNLRPLLRKAGFLTRDMRKKWPNKVGWPGPNKGPRYSKR